MLFAFGLNSSKTLLDHPTPFLIHPTQVEHVDRVVWSSWAATVGLRGHTYTVWGDSPTIYHPQRPLPPTPLSLPEGCHPKTFAGVDQLEAILGLDGFVYLPFPQAENEVGWERSVDDHGGWVDVTALGNGDWVGIHQSSPSTLRTGPTLSDLLSSSHSTIPSTSAHAPTYTTLHPSLSHVILLPKRSTVHPPAAQGSNLHSQLSLPSSTHSPVPVPLDHLAGLGAISVSSHGTSSSALTEGGDLYLWGGPYGLLDDPLPIPTFSSVSRGTAFSLSEEEEEEEEITSHLMTPTHGVLLSLSSGNVLSFNFLIDDLRPTTRPARPAPARSIGWKVVWDVRERGGSVTEVRSASGGLGVFFQVERESERSA